MVKELLRTPAEWVEAKHPGIRIIDPDGWRGANGRPMSDPITEEDFDQRFARSTIMGIPEPKPEAACSECGTTYNPDDEGWGGFCGFCC